MYPSSDSSDLTREQCVALDDTLFQSNPASYWRARIDALLREPTPVDYAAGLAAEVAALGLDAQMLTRTEPSDSERELQRALDAFALRHHLAESLVRLVHAVLTTAGEPGASIWVSLASNRDDGAKLAEDLREIEKAGVPIELFLPAEDAARYATSPSEQIQGAIRMHWRWVRRALDLLVNDGLDTNVGNNKIKHGLAVRPRDDLRVEFTTVPPNADGTFPLSAFDNSLAVVNSVAIEFLERLPRRSEHAGSHEVTVLNLRLPALLAEALLLCTIYASVFACAAERHFAGRDGSGPAHPGLVLGPPPERVVRDVVGYRQALTTSPKSGSSRGLTVETPRGVVHLTQTGPGTEGVVVSD